MADKNTADIGFEKQIWNAACVLMGNLDASEYKSVVLGLIFLKYISNRFDEKYKALLAEGDGFEEDIDEYTSEGIFFVPADARWSEEFSTTFTFLLRKHRKTIFICTSKYILFISMLNHLDICEEVNNIPQSTFIQLGACKILR